MKKLQKKAYDLIEHNRVAEGCILLLILLNVCLVIAGTFDLTIGTRKVFGAISAGSIVIFTLEYLLRLWTAPLRYPDKTPFRARMKYAFSFLALTDLLAILPIYLPFVFSVDLRVLRMARIMRLFSLFKLKRYTEAVSLIGRVMKSKARELISSMFVIGVFMLIASLLMYWAEHEAQPEVFKNALSGLWWGVITFATIGYGDMVPITVLGKLLGGAIALLGVGLVAVPTGIISAGFIEQTGKTEEKKKPYCPYCGKKIE